ncbi:MAG: Stp1/IreP family PP2C-type Ser/Thr phosphatase [Oscillospiraceae bacterium]|nr:Stp1/IreP family PP2C-type Ser/Thr phosphatase [Oscillospiraceae bacterium]
MIELFAKTDVGKVRKENQDAWRAYSDPELGEFALVVCDGMGGANAGSTASTLAAESFLAHIRSCLDAPERAAPDKILRDAVAYANACVYDRAFQDAECHGMGTTLVAALIMGTTAAVVNVGDSRAYLLKGGGELACITNDHSYVAEMVRRGLLTREEARTHPKRNIITRALGAELYVECDVFPITPEQGDALMLCSDGLTNEVREAELAQLMAQAPDAENCCTSLIELALDRGAPDNVTAAVIRVV